jgi:hypothetical protein
MVPLAVAVGVMILVIPLVQVELVAQVEMVGMDMTLIILQMLVVEEEAQAEMVELRMAHFIVIMVEMELLRASREPQPITVVVAVVVGEVVAGMVV